MKKIIFTSLLLITPFCKAADFQDINEHIAAADWGDVAQYISCCSAIYKARLWGSEYLNLSNYEAHAIPDNLNLPNLERLFLDNNQIQAIDNLNLPNLLQLHLNNNQIQAIANLNLPNLRGLFLQNNQIQAINNLNLPNLQQLYLHNNQIQAINPQIFNQLPQLRYLNLNQNPLTQENVNELRAVAQQANRHITIIADDIGEQYYNASHVKPAKRS